MAGQLAVQDNTAKATELATGVLAYSVRAERDGKFWLVHVPAVDRWTQARTVAEIEPIARDLIRIMENLPDTAADEIVLDVDVVMPPPVDVLLAEARNLTEVADTLRHSAGARTRLAAAELHASGLSFRDIGVLLKVSHQRVHQLVTEASDEKWLVKPLERLSPPLPSVVGVTAAVAIAKPDTGTGGGDGGGSGGARKPAARRAPARSAAAPKPTARRAPAKAVASSTAMSSKATAGSAAKSMSTANAPTT